MNVNTFGMGSYNSEFDPNQGFKAKGGKGAPGGKGKGKGKGKGGTDFLNSLW